MALNAENLIIGNREVTQERLVSNDTTEKLTREELQFLLSMIKQSTFQGEAIEMLYKLVIKLQNQYISIK
jgi:hypothetical protein